MKRTWRVKRVVLVAALVLSAWGWFGVSSQDETDGRRFDQLAEEWQRSPEFRAITISYCDDGSRALSATPFGVHANSVVMGLRSLPFLPKDLAVNPTSALHYRRFAMGSLCAYLHLCTEQDVPTFSKMMEDIAAKEPDSTARGRAFLGAFHMDDPVVTDVGAVQSAAVLFRDVDPSRPLVVRQNVDALLLPHIKALARELGVPEDIDVMTPEQQRRVYVRLDAQVRASDPELWRTKQLSDFCCGIWAQVYGPSYGLAIKPVLMIHQVAGAVLLALLMWMALRRGIRNQQQIDMSSAESSAQVAPEPSRTG